jgi:hypothetical protein
LELLKEEKPGFLMTQHYTKDCSDKASAFTLYRLNACQIDIDYGNDKDEVCTLYNPITLI